MLNKIVSAAEAVAIIRSGDTVAFSGFVDINKPLLRCPAGLLFFPPRP
ncbi:hypothetical protein A4U53_000635 (plasmid) [Rhizobium ruizarguesonis]|uniref:Uncharacterized protein n=1 Tax=Rhizobium ruizarguesonis TaxID=2081791 RepID=A0ACD5EF68_9HYPH|nr:hypothetical protein [Rhizobium leguminosarum]